MRLEWIDDLLAVLDAGSLSKAAQRRRLTQSAFTRRMRTIEDSIGAALFDRARKPVSLLPGVQGLAPELRELSTRLHRLRNALKTSSDQTGASWTFVCQHALTTTVAPQVVRAASKGGEVSVRLRSGNHDECLIRLLSGEVDLAVIYAQPFDAGLDVSKAFDALPLGVDQLIPVCAPALLARAAQEALPIIGYPAEAFLGDVFRRSVVPRLPDGTTTLPVAETALTLAMLHLALSEIGTAWLPHSLLKEPLAQGRLVRLDDRLPAQELTVQMVRRRGDTRTDPLWRDLMGRVQI